MIGIIGATGDLGKKCTDILNKYGVKPLKLGYRNKDKIIEKTGNFYDFIDIEDRESCKNFINDCSCIINCSSYSKLGIFNLIREVDLAGIKLIDLSSYDFIEEFKITKGVICSGVGSSPGLSELLPIVSSDYFDKVERITQYYVSLGEFTSSSAKEYVRYLFSSEIKAMSKYEKGKAVYNFDSGTDVRLPIYDKPLKKLSYLDSRLTRICEHLELEEAIFNICMKNGPVFDYLLSINRLGEVNKDEVINKLVDLSKLENIKSEEFSGFVVNSSGIRAGRRKNLEIFIKHIGPSDLTALTATSIAMLVNDKDLAPGLYKMESLGMNEEILKNMSTIDKSFFTSITEGDLEDTFKIIEGEI